MKNINLIRSILFALLLPTAHLHAAAAAGATVMTLPTVATTFRQAMSADIPGIVTLMNTEAHKESDKIVIVPEVFRAGYVETAVRDGSLFVAEQAAKIIGYKKLYCITNEADLADKLSNELRLKGTKPAACASVALPSMTPLDAASTEAALTLEKLLASPATYIYNGADFTHPAHRGTGVNTGLTQHAVAAIAPTAIEQTRRQRATHIAMVYGLTRSNAGTEGDLFGGRSRGIVNEFIPAAKTIAVASGCTLPAALLLTRHHAFKPSFDPKATECRPLSDALAIPGYGCLIACPLVPKA
jgi:hypothetical protein